MFFCLLGFFVESFQNLQIEYKRISEEKKRAKHQSEELVESLAIELATVKATSARNERERDFYQALGSKQFFTARKSFANIK